MNIAFLIDALVTVIGVTTPILLAATGELVVEKSGVLNLGVEGMMLIGAVTGFAVTLNLGDALGDWAPWAGVVGAGLAGAASSMLFGVLVLTLGSNQVATGLALAIFGIGLSSLIGARLRRHGDRALQSGVPRLAGLPTRSAGWRSATARSSISR